MITNIEDIDIEILLKLSDKELFNCLQLNSYYNKLDVWSEKLKNTSLTKHQYIYLSNLINPIPFVPICKFGNIQYITIHIILPPTLNMTSHHIKQIYKYALYFKRYYNVFTFDIWRDVIKIVQLIKNIIHIFGYKLDINYISQSLDKSSLLYKII